MDELTITGACNGCEMTIETYEFAVLGSKYCAACQYEARSAYRVRQ